MSNYNTDLLRRLAYMEHLQESYFSVIDAAGKESFHYGTEDDAREVWETDDPDGIIPFSFFVRKHYEEVTDDPGPKIGAYLVLTDDEADAEVDKYIDDYIDEVVLPLVPEHYRNYFDEDRFKKDLKLDGRGDFLASYDGVEHAVKIDGVWFYLYRVDN